MSMKKKIFHLGIFLIPFLHLAGNVASQDYTSASAEVKAKIDENKMEGKDILSGINRILTLDLESCGNAEKAKETLLVLEDLAEYKSIRFVSPGIIEVKVSSKADYTLVRDFLISKGINVRQFYGEKLELN